MDERSAVEFQFAGQDIPWLLAAWAESQPDKTFLVWEPRHGAGRRWTYAEFWHDVRSIAAGLAGRGVTSGDKVLIHSENCPEMVLAWYACATLGAVGVTTNTRSVQAELEFFIDKTGCVGAVTQPQLAPVVAAAGPGLGWIVVTEEDGDGPGDGADTGLDGFATLMGDPGDLPHRAPDPMAPAGILFTSGTTSQPKAVVHTHANALWAGRVGPTNISMEPGDTYLVFLPFFHVNAQSWSFWTALGVGGTVVLQPKFSSSRFWDVVTEHRVTHLSLIPFVYNALAGQAIPEHSVKVGVFGLIVPELEQWLGFRVVPAYGMTETVIHATNDNPGRMVPRGSMGKPTPGYELLVVDRDTGEICRNGEPGELWVRGTRGVQLFLEYYDNPEAMAKSFTDDGWFKTGDVVRLGEGGNYFYCDRDADVLKVGGENVSAREVEDACRQVPGVGDVAVVAQSHEMLSEVPVAFVVRGPGADSDDDRLEKAVIEQCASILADFKVPRAVYFVDEFPRATLDKVAKNKLREQADQLASEREGELTVATVAKPAVVLFDVDETLVHTGGSGARSWKAAFDQLYGIPADIGAHSSAGETDPAVARATFTAVLGRDPTDEELDRLYARYLLHLADDILVSDGYRVLPGAERTLGALSEAGVMLGLVSGAMEGAARTKLVPANLNRFFIFGAYGSDSPDRAELTKLAIDKAAQLHSRLLPSQVFVVGDTPRDIDAAKAAGAVSVGVASGHFSLGEMTAAGGDHVLASLEAPFPGL